MSDISCRAQVHPACYDGKPEDRVYEGGAREDGTFRDGTVICDPCFIALMPFTPSGRGMSDELDAAIGEMRLMDAAPGYSEGV